MHVPMKHRFSGLLLAAVMFSVVLLPKPAAAYRKVWLDQRNQDQNHSVQLTSVSPSDPDAQELLKLLQIEISASDPVWQDQTFIDLVATYKDIRAKSLGVVSDVGDIVVEAFDLADLLSRVDSDTFRKQFSMTEEERAQLQEMRGQLQDQLAEFKQDPEAFLSEFLSQLPDRSNYFDEYTGVNYGINGYGYADPYEPVEEGRIVWLIDGSYSEQGKNWTTEWTQVDGPEVQWLATDSEHDRAFIVPSLEGYPDLTYLTFEQYVKDEDGNESTSYVYVDLARDSQPQSEVAQLYQEVMGYEIADEDLTYWQAKYDQGMSLDDIRKHFELFKELGW